MFIPYVDFTFVRFFHMFFHILPYGSILLRMFPYIFSICFPDFFRDVSTCFSTFHFPHVSSQICSPSFWRCWASGPRPPPTTVPHYPELRRGPPDSSPRKIPWENPWVFPGENVGKLPWESVGFPVPDESWSFEMGESWRIPTGNHGKIMGNFRNKMTVLEVLDGRIPYEIMENVPNSMELYSSLGKSLSFS